MWRNLTLLSKFSPVKYSAALLKFEVDFDAREVFHHLLLNLPWNL